jgi:uncharacterized protein
MNDSDQVHGEILQSLLDNVLHLILLPTEKCNFRCIYCYEDFSVGKMAPATVRGIKRLLERRIPDLRHLSIDWFGGEPLLASDIIEDVCQHVCNLAKGHADLRFDAGITTNGHLLSRDMVSKLHSVGVRNYQISLDGPRELHDQTRKQVNGHGSFDRIWNNLGAIQKSSLDVNVLLRIHLTPRNLPAMDKFLADLQDTLLHDPRFSIFLKPIERLGGPNNETIDTIPHDDTPAVLHLLRKGLNARGPSPEIDRPHVCYASKPNSFVVRANGIIAKCTVALEDPRNHIGRITPDGVMSLDNAKVRPWLRGLQTLDLHTLGCPLDDFPVPLDASLSRGGLPLKVLK